MIFEISKFIDHIVDDNSIKHNLYSPGDHKKVYPTSSLNENKPDYILILAWQHQESIINRCQDFIDRGVKLILPLPEFKII